MRLNAPQVAENRIMHDGEKGGVVKMQHRLVLSTKMEFFAKLAMSDRLHRLKSRCIGFQALITARHFRRDLVGLVKSPF